jgi:vacuolar-type H+-ATPase subunit I/STV1
LIDAPEKKLSKKDKKRLEKEEADKLLAALGEESVNQVEETKEEANGESEVVEKRKANQIKKERKKKDKEVETTTNEPHRELTEEERKAAKAEILAKLQTKTEIKRPVNELIQSAILEQAERKKKSAAKKGKAAW